MLNCPALINSFVAIKSRVVINIGRALLTKSIIHEESTSDASMVVLSFRIFLVAYDRLFEIFKGHRRLSFQVLDVQSPSSLITSCTSYHQNVPYVEVLKTTKVYTRNSLLLHIKQISLLLREEE